MSHIPKLTLSSLDYLTPRVVPPPLELSPFQAFEKQIREKIEKEYTQKLLKAKQLLVQEMKDRNGECSICKAKSEGSTVFLDCGHSYHTQCIGKWIQIANGSPHCPDSRHLIIGLYY